MNVNLFLKHILSSIALWAILLLPSQLLAQQDSKSTLHNIEDVNITIDAATTMLNLEDINLMLADYGIVANFKDIKRNGEHLIIGLNITLTDKNGKTVTSQFLSNIPIDHIAFGRRHAKLYVDDDNDLTNKSTSEDALVEKEGAFSESEDYDANRYFNNPHSMFLFEGDSLTIDQIKERMMQNFSFKNARSDRFAFLFDETHNNRQTTCKFSEDVTKKKVIVIDGKISDFKTLNALAKKDLLDAVDVLKPKIAISVYGNKARDGAIIATTKH